MILDTWVVQWEAPDAVAADLDTFIKTGWTIRDFVLRDTIEGSWKGALEAKGKKYPADFYELTPLVIGLSTTFIE